MDFRIKEIRESKGMKQAELVEKAGVARANALGVTIGELFLPNKV